MGRTKNMSHVRVGSKKDVFVVHGRNTVATDSMFDFLRVIGLNPIDWSQAREQTGKGSPYIGEILDAAFNTAQAIVVLMTPDEIAYLRPEYADGEDDPDTKEAPQARPNVLFEAGMAFGRDPDRTILVELGKVRRFSDVAGRHTLRMSGSVVDRRELARRLQTAGCDVDLSRDAWLTRDYLKPPLPPSDKVLPVNLSALKTSNSDKVHFVPRSTRFTSGTTRGEVPVGDTVSLTIDLDVVNSTDELIQVESLKVSQLPLETVLFDNSLDSQQLFEIRDPNGSPAVSIPFQVPPHMRRLLRLRVDLPNRTKNEEQFATNIWELLRPCTASLEVV